MIVAVDPDTKTPGLAAFDAEGLLFYAGASEDSLDLVCDLFDVHDHGLLVIEVPQTYGGRAAGGADANVLIQLARVVGRFEQCALSRGGRVRAVSPRVWKGNAPKHITIQRAWDVLNGTEKTHVAKRLTTQAHRKLLAGEGLKSGPSCDLMDAVALGLWYLNRHHLKNPV